LFALRTFAGFVPLNKRAAAPDGAKRLGHLPLPDLASEVCMSVSRTISLLRSPLLENSPQLFGEVVAW
jgi:hypothetical protein